MVSPEASSAGGTFNIGHWREKKKNNNKWNPNTLSFVICRDDIITVQSLLGPSLASGNQVPMCRLKNHTFGYLNNCGPSFCNPECIMYTCLECLNLCDRTVQKLVLLNTCTEKSHDYRNIRKMKSYPG